jgi:hypothetical protein
MNAAKLCTVTCVTALLVTTGPGGRAAIAQSRTATSRATLTAHAGIIAGTVLDGTEKPIPAARLRLRDLGNGRIVMTTRGDQGGRFQFAGVPAGNYLVELVDESGAVRAVGQAFEMPAGGAVTTLIRLGARAPWYHGFFSNAAVAAVSSAAGLGVTAIGTGMQPASGRF